jgi:dienelactone hydrolase
MPDDRRLRDVAHWRDIFQMPVYTSREEWLARAAGIRRRILVAAGLLPEPERTPLRPIVTGRIERDGYTIENVAFESFPGFYCTGNLYRPSDRRRPAPAVLTPHGHWRDGRFAHEERGSVPARCISFALQGYVAFSPDMVGYNDSRQAPHRTFESPQRWLWGISVLGLQLWNNIRALDFLCSLPDVDPDRIACTGESGGASQTFLLAAVDERVRYVAPVNMLSAHYAGGCVCENAPGLRLELNNMEIVACAAPRPMLLVAATGDWTVNTPRLEYPAVRSIYELFGAADALECVQLDAPHNYNRDSRQAVYGFLARHLGGRGERAPRPETATFWTGPSEPLREREGIAPEPRQRLRVFPDDAPLPGGALPDAAAVTARLRALAMERLAQARPATAEQLAAFRDRWGPVFHDALAAHVPAPGEVEIQHRTREERDGYAVERFEIAGRRYGERIPAVALLPAVAAGEGGVPALLIDGRGKERWLVETDATPAPGPLAQALLENGRAVLLVDPFLTGAYLTPFGQAGRPTCETHFAGYNRVDTCWRVQDVLTAAAALRTLTGAAQIDLAGRGDAGLWCLLARALAPDLFRRMAADAGRFRWDDEQEYLERLYVPHLLRAGGLATAVALAAPAPLLVFNTGGPLPEWLGALYRGLGAPERLRVEEGAFSEHALYRSLQDEAVGAA